MSSKVQRKNSDIVKGLISIAGDSVVKADLKFKIPKLSNGTFGTFIFDQFPWKLQQLQDAHNHLILALEEVNEREVGGIFTSGQEINQLMESIMCSLSRGKSLLLVPPKQPLPHLISSGMQRVLNPPLPDEVLVNFHVNCDKLVFCAYVLNCLTGPPSNLKNLPQDPNNIGHVFESGSRWFEVVNRIEIVCTVPWLKEIIILFNTAQQLCQQLKDKLTLFSNILSTTDLDELALRRDNAQSDRMS
ncbi:protein rogdi homolog isoform X2 [Rhopilema esculentum]|uniref:protein rogdi homolog isoform X2 n=1 Tax=Rhopilema esculentum TaxID=499914 RepID=UPI0031CF60BD